MAEVMDVINAFGTPLKVAWVVWLAWGVGQYFWYRHERAGDAAKKLAVAPTAVARESAVVEKPAAPAAEAPVLGRLITTQHVEAEPAPAFDPSAAVIETFAGAPSDGALDRFVAEFEMQDARPRRRRSRSADSPSFSAEAPRTP